MSRLLAIFLILHWAVAFALLTGLVMMSGDGGLLPGYKAIAQVNGGALLTSGIVSAVIGFGFAACALLFSWALLLLLSAGTSAAALDDVLRLAFSCACGMVTIILVIGVVDGVQGLYAAVGAQLAAIVASYMVVRTELAAPRHLVANDDRSIAVRAIAMGASRSARLQRFAPSRDVKRGFDR